MMSDNDNAKRAELKQRLRQKIRSKRNPNENSGPQLTKRLGDDPASTLLSMGIDDASIISNAKSIVQQSKSILQNSSSTGKSTKMRDVTKVKSNPEIEQDEEDIVEAPPN
jgi:hypothetical protein